MEGLSEEELEEFQRARQALLAHMSEHAVAPQPGEDPEFDEMCREYPALSPLFLAYELRRTRIADREDWKN